jgi:hypothetical protein
MGQMDKVKKIYDRLIESNPRNGGHVMRVVRICLKERDAEGVLRYVEMGEKYLQNKSKEENEAMIINLNFSKCEALIMQSRHQ